MRASTVVRPERIHRGVVICNINDILPEGWQDWMEVPAWPETCDEAPLCGLGPKRWRTLADRAKTIQEREVAKRLGDYSTVEEVAEAMGLSKKRVQQIGRQLLDHVVKPKAGRVQVDMFDGDGGDE
ncbi:MAG: hypothetical protein ACYCXX_14670 [Acidiferrobacter thiooxydans]